MTKNVKSSLKQDEDERNLKFSKTKICLRFSHFIHFWTWTFTKNISSRSLEQKNIIHTKLGSDGKESACNAEDLGSIPGSGRAPGEGKGYLL